MTVVDLYTIQIIREDGEDDMRHLEHTFDTETVMDEIEENITDLLPNNYKARIRKWNDLSEGTDDE